MNQPPQSPHHEESPQHQTVSYHNQNQNQLPFQLHQQSHFAQPSQQQVMPLQQQFGGGHESEMIRSGGSSSSSGRDWRLPVEEERSINLNSATERVQPSRRFHDHDRSYEEASSSHRAAAPPPSTDLTWSSKPTPTSEPIALQSSGQFQPPRSSNQAAQLSLLSLVSDQPSVSQPNRSNQTQTHSVSKPQPVSKLFPMSQPSSNPLAGTGLREAPRPFAVSKQPPTSKPFSGSQSSSQKSKPFAVSQPPTTSKPSSVSQRSLNSNPFPVTEPPPQRNSNPFPVSEPPQQRSSNPFPVSQPTPNTKASAVSQPPQTSSNPFRVSQPKPQPPPTSRPIQVSQPQPQPPPASSNPFLVSQPTTASKPLPVSQQPSTSTPMPVTQTPPHHAFQSTSHSQPPVASGGPSPLPPIFNSTQSFQPQPVSASTTPPPAPSVSTTPSPIPVVSTNPSPPQPTGVTNQTQRTDQTPSSDSNQKVPSFWTTCPYCFVLFEYPNMYEESVLKCQTKSCRRAFQAVKVPSPPPVDEEEDSYYCCWGFYPIGFTETAKIPPVHDLPRGFPVHGLHNRSGFTEATKIPVYDIPRTAPKKASRKVYYNEDEDDDEYIDSDPSEDEDDDDDDDDWHVSGTKRRKSVKQSKQKASTKPRLGKPRKVIVVD